MNNMTENKPNKATKKSAKPPMDQRMKQLGEYAVGLVSWVVLGLIGVVVGIADTLGYHLDYLLSKLGINDTHVPRWLCVILTVVFPPLVILLIVAAAVVRILLGDQPPTS